MSRERLPKRRESVTYSLELDSQKLHVDLGLYPDGRVGELFVDASKVGSAMQTALEAWAMAVSKGLQHGVLLREFTRTLAGTRETPVFVQCEVVPAIHGTRVLSTWDALARLLDAVTDEKGVFRG